MANRIYLVYPRDGGIGRLVRAPHPSRALGHVAASTYDVRVAEQEDIVGAMQAGIKPETAGAEPEPAADPRQQPLVDDDQAPATD